MGLFSFHRAKPRRFSYDPRFYDSSKDERLKRRMRTARPEVRRKTRQPAFIAVGLGLLAVLYVYVNIDQVVASAARLGDLFFGG